MGEKRDFHLRIARTKRVYVMNFINLQYFLVVAKELNITSAAKKIHISQQALSQHIRSLEEELETELFARTPRLQLTPAGVCLANASSRILDLKESAITEIQRINHQQPQKLRLGISQARSEQLLPNILPKFCAENPQVVIELLEGGADVTQPELELGNLDLILLVRPDYPNFTQVELIYEELYVVASYSLFYQHFGEQTDAIIARLREKFDFSYLRNMPLIMLRKSSTIRSIFENFLAEKEIVPRILLENANVQTSLTLAQSGVGVTLYPDLFLRQHTSRFTHSNALYFPVGRYGPLVACYNPKYPLTPAAASFLSCIKDWLGGVDRPNPGFTVYP